MLTAYEPSVRQDLQLYGWYEQLVLSGDIKKIFGFDGAALGHYSLSVFLQHFQAPVVLLTAGDEKGWWFCLWAHPSHNGSAEVSVWIREGKRHSQTARQLAYLGLEALLVQFPMLIALTFSEEVALIHAKMGFVRLGTLPATGDDGPVFVNYLTREAFAALQETQKQAAHG